MGKEEMKDFFDVKDMIEYPKDGILSKVIEKNSKYTIDLFCMAKKTEIGEHTSSRRAIVYVLEGKGVFHLDGKNIQMTPGVIINMKENALHSISSIENTAFLLILIN